MAMTFIDGRSIGRRFDGCQQLPEFPRKNRTALSLHLAVEDQRTAPRPDGVDLKYRGGAGSYEASRPRCSASIVVSSPCPVCTTVPAGSANSFARIEATIRPA